MEDGLFIGLLDRLLLAGLLALHQLALVQLCVHTQWFQFVPGKRLKRKKQLQGNLLGIASSTNRPQLEGLYVDQP